MVYLCLGGTGSVMKCLFENGNYGHILEEIFYLLDPKSLSSASRVCKNWNAFLEKRIWYNGQGHRRITENWLSKSPRVKEIPIPFTPCEVKDLKVHYKVMEKPMSIVIVENDLICTVIGNIDVYDKNSGRLKKRLCKSNYLIHWKLSVNKEFLLAYQSGHFIGKVILWDRRKDYAEIRLQGISSMANNFAIVSDRMIISECSKSAGKILLGLGINFKEQTTKIAWASKSTHQLFSLCGSNILTCEADNEDASLEVLEKDTGRTVHKVNFDCGEYDTPKGLCYTRPVGIALMSKAVEAQNDGWLTFKIVGSKIFLFDMAHGFLIRELEIDCSRYVKQ